MFEKSIYIINVEILCSNHFDLVNIYTDMKSPIPYDKELCLTFKTPLSELPLP